MSAEQTILLCLWEFMLCWAHKMKLYFKVSKACGQFWHHNWGLMTGSEWGVSTLRLTSSSLFTGCVESHLNLVGRSNATSGVAAVGHLRQPRGWFLLCGKIRWFTLLCQWRAQNHSLGRLTMYLPPEASWSKEWECRGQSLATDLWR